MVFSTVVNVAQLVFVLTAAMSLPLLTLVVNVSIVILLLVQSAHLTKYVKLVFKLVLSLT